VVDGVRFGAHSAVRRRYKGIDRHSVYYLNCILGFSELCVCPLVVWQVYQVIIIDSAYRHESNCLTIQQVRRFATELRHLEANRFLPDQLAEGALRFFIGARLRSRCK
jgi:hypothetical protein